MTSIDKREWLIVITGPTAIGKTSLSIDLANHLSTEIISADSRQFFRELRIGVAAPTDEELAQAKHHFVGHLSINNYYNAYQYELDVMEFLQAYFKNNNIAILCGGSGLYIDAVCNGIDLLPDPTPELRKTLIDLYEEQGINALQEKLLELDPDYHAVVDLNNSKRILRALEVCLSTGKKYSSLRLNKKKERPFNIIKIGLELPREILVKKIHQRVDQMIMDGLVDEVRGLVNYRNLNALNTVGYKEIFNYLEGNWSLEHAIEKIKTNTRRYAKRQMTWLKKDKDIRWFSPEKINEISDYINVNYQ